MALAGPPTLMKTTGVVGSGPSAKAFSLRPAWPARLCDRWAKSPCSSNHLPQIHPVPAVLAFYRRSAGGLAAAATVPPVHCKHTTSPKLGSFRKRASESRVPASETTASFPPPPLRANRKDNALRTMHQPRKTPRSPRLRGEQPYTRSPGLVT
jgi:hypothetical protein